MLDLHELRALISAERGLAVVAVPRDDGTVGASVVNAGLLAHPLDGRLVVGFVSGGTARRLDRLRAGSPITVTFRAGFRWASVEGHAQIVGPDDPAPAIPPKAIPQLLRDIFTAAGGTHDDWDAYDAVMAAERRAAVLIRPERVYSNPPGPASPD